jgi:hypothetical protein
MTSLARPLLVLVLLTSVLAACSAGTLPSDPPVDVQAPTPVPSAGPSAAPSGSPEAGGLPGGGAGGDPGGGAVIDPAGELVVPQPGQVNVMPIPLERIEAGANGRTVTLTLSWSSGVAPCSVLDQVLIDKGSGTLDVTIREGTSDPQAMCVLMLQAKQTVVQLELEPGEWVVRDSQAGAAPVEITVS